MAAQSRGPTNPYYYGKAEDIDPTYLALIQILQQMMAGINKPTGQPGPGGSYNPFAWMDEGGLSPDQKRLADEQMQAVERQQAMNWNLDQPGMRDYLGTKQADGSFQYQPTPQDVLGWNDLKEARREKEEESSGQRTASTRGASKSSSSDGSMSSNPLGMLTPEMLTAFMKSFQGGGADAGVLESIDKEIQGLRDSMPPEGPEKQAALERIAMLQETKDKMLSGSGIEGGGMVDQLQQLLGLFAGPQKRSEISVDIPEGTTGVPSKTRFGVGALPATGAGTTVDASYLTGPEAALTTMGLYTPEDDRQKLLDKAKTQSSQVPQPTGVTSPTELGSMQAQDAQTIVDKLVSAVGKGWKISTPEGIEIAKSLPPRILEDVLRLLDSKGAIGKMLRAALTVKSCGL